MRYFIDLSLIRKNSQFRLLFLSSFVSLMGTMITYVALPYQVYHLTHKIIYVGLLSFSTLIPMVFTALLGGVIADQHSRRKILLIGEIISVVCLGGLTWNAHSAHPSIILVFILAIISGSASGFYRPAYEGIMQQIVAKEDYPALASMRTFTWSVGAIAGPMVGGLLIAHAGLANAYAVDFGSYVFSYTMILLLRHVPKPTGAQKEKILSSLKSGLKYAMSRQVLLGSYAADIIAMVFGMPYALFPALAHHFQSPEVLGYFYAAPAVGALIVSIFSGTFSGIKRYGAGIAVAALLWGAAIVALGFTWKHLWVGLFFLVLAGAFDTISGIFRSTLWNETIPENYRGRLSGIEMVSYMSGPRLGDAEAALIASFFGFSVSIVSGGVLCVVGVGILSYYLPKFWQFKSNVTT